MGLSIVQTPNSDGTTFKQEIVQTGLETLSVYAGDNSQDLLSTFTNVHLTFTPVNMTRRPGQLAPSAIGGAGIVTVSSDQYANLLTLSWDSTGNYVSPSASSSRTYTRGDTNLSANGYLVDAYKFSLDPSSFVNIAQVSQSQSGRQSLDLSVSGTQATPEPFTAIGLIGAGVGLIARRRQRAKS